MSNPASAPGAQFGLMRLIADSGVSASARVLDIGGCASRSSQTIPSLLDEFGSENLTIFCENAGKRRLFGSEFGEGLRYIDSFPPEEEPYDLVVLSSIQKRVIDDLLDFTTFNRRRLKRGGWLVASAVVPEALSKPSVAQPTREVLEAFAESFRSTEDGLALSGQLARYFRLVELLPRKRGGAGFMGWGLFQRLEEDLAAVEPVRAGKPAARVAEAGPSTFPIPSPAPPPLRPNVATAPAALTEAVNLKAPVSPDLVLGVPRYGPPERAEVLRQMDFPELPDAARALLESRDFDTVMFVNNSVKRDARVVKTARTVSDLGRALLLVGLNEEPDIRLDELDGTPIILLPNLNRPLSRELKRAGFPLDAGPRYELWLGVSAAYIAHLLANLRKSALPIVLHSHDFLGAYAMGCARTLTGRDPLMRRADLRWIHDVHEYVREYDIIDPTLQALGCLWEDLFYPQVETLTTVSGYLARKLHQRYPRQQTPAIIYNSNRLSAQRKYRGPPLREIIGVPDAPIAVHSGSIRSGRGVDYLIEALPSLPQLHLLLITGATTPYLTELLTRAEQIGVRERIHLHPLLPHDEVAGFIEEATIGAIPMDHYGNADVALPNKLFDYVQAGLPVVSADTLNLRQLLQEWPIGPLFPAGSVSGLVDALQDAIDNRSKYRANLISRPDLHLAFSWEAQSCKLRDIYAELSSETCFVRELQLPQF